MISIFAKRAFVNVNPGQEWDGRPVRRGHLLRVSSIIRADQIAQAIGARLNPLEGFENDVCIYVKPHVKTGEEFEFKGKPYLDIIDGWNLLSLLERHLEVGVIAISEMDYHILKKRLPRHNVVLIPQHHVNFERLKRKKDSVVNVGVIGTEGSFTHLPISLERELHKRGMKLVTLSRFESRKGIQEFYQSLFVQMVWRPYKRRLGNPLKIVNAASFGVPTISLEEEYFKEVEDCYLPVQSFEQFLNRLDMLIKSPRAYTDYQEACLVKSEKYHIDWISALYLNL